MLAKLPRIECTLEVTLTAVTSIDASTAEAAARTGGGIAAGMAASALTAGVFDPPLGQQRYELVARVAAEEAASSVLDLGGFG